MKLHFLIKHDYNVCFWPCSKKFAFEQALKRERYIGWMTIPIDQLTDFYKTYVFRGKRWFRLFEYDKAHLNNKK